MILTHFRAKISKHLSYPVGVEAITVGLAGVPHAEALRLVFYSHPVEPASRFQRVLTERLPYPIVAAEYHPARKPGLSAAELMIERGWYDERWELRIYPVLREFRHTANRLLIEQGLPVLSRWLDGVNSGPRGMTTLRAGLVFNPAEALLTMSETSKHESSRV